MFTYQPANSSGKYCSWKCLTDHRERLSAASGGLHFRKLVMRAGLHHNNTLLRVWAKLAIGRAPLEERSVILHDLLKEHEQVEAEVKRIYQNLSTDTRTFLEQKGRELDKALNRSRSNYPERHEDEGTVKCKNTDCNVELTKKAGRCYNCGRRVQ